MANYFKIFLTGTCLWFTALVIAAGTGSVHAASVETPLQGKRAAIQIDPDTEQLDQVSEPIGELSEPVEGAPTEPLDAVSETDDQASDEVGQDIAPTEQLDQVSETDDQASEEIGSVSETAEEASEILPSAPEGEEYGIEEGAPEGEMPLGDREAEGKGLGY